MNIIYKVGFLIAMMISSITGMAQSKSDKLYSMFEGKDGFTVLGFSKSMIKPLEIFLDDDTKKVIYKMEQVRFMNYNKSAGKLSSEDIFKRITKTLSGDQYFIIDENEINQNGTKVSWNSEDDGQVLLIGHGNKNKMDEFHVVTLDGGHSILVSFFGQITIEDLKGCAQFGNSMKGNHSFNIQINP